MRIDHWIKQLFIIPGTAFALLLLDSIPNIGTLLRFILGFISTCCIASSNYVINEWLDAEFDKFHPVKKHRAVVEEGVEKPIVYLIYFVLAVLGLSLARLISRQVFFMELWLWIMGILYNVRPFRTKDIPFVDVLTESVNNAIRLLIGWFIVTSDFYPPVSLVFGYWFGGAFLMATKRFAEFRMINDPELAGKYRKSFKKYSEKSLLLSSFFYAMCSTFFTGIFLIKYKIELILFVPFLIGLFCYYFMIAFKEDSAAQKPEKLFKEKGLMLYVLLLCILLLILMIAKISFLEAFSTDILVSIQ